jgi:two-component system, sensor histidine kinase LadS
MSRLRDHRMAMLSTLLRKLPALRFAFLGLIVASPAHAFVLPAEDALYVENFATEVELLEDTRGALDIATVSSPSARFQPATPATANVGFTDSVWWVRFTVRNPHADERRVFVRQNYPLIDYLNLYEQGADGRWREIETGDRRVFHSRPIANRDFIFPLAAPANSERTFYLRYQSQGPVDISLSMYATPDLLESLSREQIAFGIYFGCVIMLLVWSGLVFIAVRDRAFLAYFTYVGTFGLYMSVSNGLAFQFLWPDSPRWANTSVIVLICIALIAAVQFSRMILHAKHFAPKLDWVAKFLQWIAVTLVIAAPFASYALLIAPVAGLILLAVIFMLTLGIVCMLLGSRPARLYVLAWGSFLCGSIVFLLKIFGLLPHTFFTQNGWQIGSLLEMILLSMSLSTRMNELQHQNRTDPLTLLGNRRMFDHRLPTELAIARTLKRPLSLLMLDIDHFKPYNDRHGHARGDEAIKIVADVLRQYVRKPHIACRFGGEEFTIILPGMHEQDAHALAERLRKGVEEALSGDLKITVSVGYACTSQSHFETADKLFDAADFALYSAKQQGRNRVAAFTQRRAPQAAAGHPDQALGT